MDTGRPRWLGFALLAAVLAAVPLVSVLFRPDDDPKSTIDRAPRTPVLQPAEKWPIAAVDFSDADTGFALQRRCETHCRTVLLAIGDRRGAPGKSELPPELDGAGPDIRVIALGGCRVVVEQRSAQRWYSPDCGARWRTVDPRPTGQTAAIPVDGVLEIADGDLAVTLPESGERTRLRATPSLKELAEPYAAGRAWWVQGRDVGTGRPAVAVSRDDGRSWTTTVLPRPQGFDPDGLLYLTARGKDAYAVASGLRSDNGHGLLAVHHSDDYGRTWQQTWPAESRDARLEGQPIVTSYGLLLMGGDEANRRFWLSFDHGATFSSAGWDLPGGWPHWTRGGYVVAGAGEQPGWYRSLDGVTWHVITFATE